ncbi:MAG TPA: MFS transporter [Actinomycetota bacterium]|nr:MFS transporter [Actinomycetota bacterium]
MRTTTSTAAVRRLAVARLISITGGAASYTALMFTVFRLTGSPTWLSATLLLTFGVSGLFGPLGGAISDRFDRRKVMIWSDLLGAACFGAMAFVTRDPWWLAGLAFASAVVETPFWSASGAAIPNLVDTDRLAWANGLVALGKNAGVMVGPAVGGVLLAAMGPGWVFGLNALTFVVSAAWVWSVRGRSFGGRAHDAEHQGLRAGFVFLARDRVLRLLVVAWSVLVLGIGLVMVADVPLVELFHAGSIGYGLLIGCWGAGSVLGSLAARRLDERKEPRALFLGTLAFALSTGAIAVSPWFAPILVMAFVSGFGDAVTLVAEQGIQQRRTPDAVRSRVMAAADGIMTITFAVGLVAAGPVLRAMGPQNAYAIGGLTALGGAVVLTPIFRGTRAVAPAPIAEPTEVAVVTGR